MSDIQEHTNQPTLFAETEVVSTRQIGVDFINLVEFPLAVLTRDVPDNVKTLEFTDELYDKALGKMVRCHLTVTGSDKYGLARAFDEDVLMALIQLTENDGFRNRSIPYTRYQIIKIIGKSDYGDQYKKIEESIDRWGSISIISKNGWWRGKKHGLGDNTFHILTAKVNREADGSEQRYFTWGEEMFEEIKSKRIRAINMDIYRGLTHPLAKRLYRWLDKTFSYADEVDRNVVRMLCDKFGMWRGKDISTLKRRLEPAIRELENAGVIKRKDYKKRYTKAKKKEWYIKLEKPKSLDKSLDVEDEVISNTHARLRALGVNEVVIVRLISENPKEFLDHQLDIMDAILRKDNHGVNDPPALFVKMLTGKEGDKLKGLIPPKGFKSQAELEFEEEKASETKAKLEEEKLAETIEDLKMAADRKMAEIAADLAAGIDDATEAELIKFIKANSDADSLVDECNFRSMKIEVPDRMDTLVLWDYQALRRQFIEKLYPERFDNLNYAQIAGDDGRFNTTSRKVLEAAIRQLEEAK